MAKDSKIEYDLKHQTYISTSAYTSTERKLKITITQNGGVAESHARVRGAGKKGRACKDLDCELQTYFGSWLLTAPKITSSISSCKTISVTLFLFFCPQPIKLSDRKMRLITRAKSRGPPTVAVIRVGKRHTPKETDFFFAEKGKISSLKKKVKIFS